MTSDPVVTKKEIIQPELVKEVNLNRQLNQQVWQALKNFNNPLNKNELSILHLVELVRLDDYFGNEIKSLGYQTRNNVFHRTESGYTIHRLCNQSQQSRCTSRWAFKIDLNGQGSIHLFRRCDHMMTCR